MLQYTTEKLFYDSTMPVIIRDSEQAEFAELHTHDFVEIVIVRQGRGEHLIAQGDEKRSSTVIKGDVFTVLPGEIHAYGQCRAFRLYNVCIRAEFLRQKFAVFSPLKNFGAFFNPDRAFAIRQMHLVPVKFAAVELQIRKLAQALRSTRPSRTLAVELELEELLLMLYDESLLNWQPGGAAGRERIFQAITQLEEHPEQKFSLEKFAAKAGMSVSGFAHHFKAICGLSPNEYCLMLRLERARRMLETEDVPVGEVALACGFCDGNYMVRLFKRAYKVTPGSYRNTYRLGKGLAAESR